MILRRLFMTLLVAVSFSTPAMADLLDQASVELHVVQESNGLHGVVMVHSRWGAVIDGDIRFTVNGQVLKVEPVLTNGDDSVNTWIAPAGTTVFACADLVGKAWTVGDQYQPVEERACTFVSSEAFPGPVPPRVPLAPPARPGAGLVRQQR